jgi:hypothetical protein
VFYLSWQLFHWIPGSRAVVGGVLQNPTAVVAFVLAWKVSRRGAGSDRFALSWRLIALGILGQMAGSVATIVYTIDGAAPYPSLADPLFLSFYPCVLAGLLLMPTATSKRSEWLRLGLHLAVTALGGAMIVSYLVLGPTVQSGGQSPTEEAIDRDERQRRACAAEDDCDLEYLEERVPDRAPTRRARS